MTRLRALLSMPRAHPKFPNLQPFEVYKSISVDGLKIFYREAGPKNAPVILLLHRFPSSSHMFRNLIPALSDSFRLIVSDFRDSATARCRQQKRMNTPSTIWPN